jgi:16S rRNA (uracil1498-N3)-methyltransferase
MANIHLGIAPTKNTDRMEWFVEKATEIGIDTISLLLCAHSERAAIKTDRLEKIAISAMKQSLKYKLPGIQPMQLLKDFLNAQQAPQKFIAFVDQQNPDHLVKVAKPGIDSIVLIGPEGDFSTKEVELAQSYGYKKIGLGPSRLRTETAGLVSCHILNLINNT